jgi:uncharacterized protein YdeI (YjbR/CyaY-like superfamily)
LISLGAAGFYLALGPTWRRDNGIEAGATVEVVLHPSGVQVQDLSPDIGQAFESEPAARARFESLAGYYRRNFIRWIESAKRQETREARIKRMIHVLKKQ